MKPGQSKSLVYSDLSSNSFEFNIDIKLKKPWVGPIDSTNEFEVPLISISHISGHYTSYETVYTLTSTANYYHIWNIYEFGSNTGTSAGFVPTFSLYS